MLTIFLSPNAVLIHDLQKSSAAHALNNFSSVPFTSARIDVRPPVVPDLNDTAPFSISFDPRKWFNA